MAWRDRDLVCWQRAHRLVLEVYQQTSEFPDSERFGITNQLRRAASSAAANIAEGSGRETNKDFLRFLFTSRGSLKEVEYFLQLARDLEMLNEGNYQRLNGKLTDVIRPMAGLFKSLKN